MIHKIDSFVSASNFPRKIFAHPKLIKSLNVGHIYPIHIQLSPTNRCNLSCTWCSLSNRELDQELPIEQIEEFIATTVALGTIAVTITGGGEPLMHKNVNDLFEIMAVQHRLKLGLITNGLAFKRLKPENYKHLTWCRISQGDLNKFNDRTADNYKYAIESGPNVNFSFSYVLTENMNLDLLVKIVRFANENTFSHVRIVYDMFATNPIDADSAKQALKDAGVDDSIVLYQGEKQHTSGQRNCYISLLKPFIGADGIVYPCCGVQYALGNDKREFPSLMRMGHISDYRRIIEQASAFDGSICRKCYYGNYNDILSRLTSTVEHIEFV